MTPFWEEVVVLRLPANTRLPMIKGHFERQEDGSFVAEYTIEELSWAMACIELQAGSDRLRDINRAREAQRQADDLQSLPLFYDRTAAGGGHQWA